MSAPQTIRYAGQLYVRADQPQPPTMTGPLGVGPHMPHHSPVSQPAVRPPGGGQSAGGPGGPSRPLQGPPLAPTVAPKTVRKLLRHLLRKLRQATALTVDLRDRDLRQLLADYRMPGLTIVLNEWAAARDRLQQRLDDAEMELESTGREPAHEPSLAPSLRLKQEPWPDPRNPFSGPRNR
jgi:hypothetical protein